MSKQCLDNVQDILPKTTDGDNVVPKIIIPPINSSNQEDKSSSTSSTGDSTVAASALVSLVTIDQEHQQIATNFNPTSLPDECYTKEGWIIDSVYKKHVWSILRVEDINLMSRNFPMEAVSFYECILLIETEKNIPGVMQVSRPRGKLPLADHKLKIKVIRDSLHSEIMDPYTDKYDPLVNNLRSGWTKDNLRETYPDVPLSKLDDLLKIQTPRSYVCHTSEDWYQVCKIELTAVPAVLKFNLLVWDLDSQTYHNYSNVLNNEWCIMSKRKCQFNLLYLPNYMNGIACQQYRFNKDKFSKEMRCIFNLNDDVVKNYNHYFAF
jgi:hypothetical protein